jgi:hypothetical protein
MLVMYTLNNSVASKLPQTSNIKFIDVWIIYGLFIHFLIIILLVLIEHLPDQENVVFMDDSKAAQRPGTTTSIKEITKTFSRKVLPIIQVAFVICYMISACIIYNIDFN